MSTFSMGSKNESEQGCTSLMLACELGHAACIKALLCSTNIKLDHREKRSGNSAYHFCCMGRMASANEEDVTNNNNVSALDTLMSHTPNSLRKRVLLLTNREGKNIAHIACARGDLLLLKCVINHLSNVSSQMPWKALTATDRLGHTPFISAVSAAMVNLFFEMGYDARTTTGSALSQIIRYDISRSLLELMLIRLSTDGGEEADTENYELIRLLVANGANPHKSVLIRSQQKPKTRGDDAIVTLTGEEDTPLSLAVRASDFQSIECILQSYMHALAVTQSLRRKDPLLISQPESYFRAVEERETDTIQCSLQSALAKALFLTWQTGDFNMAGAALFYTKEV
ncbi:hypothetical protein QTG54_004316 [Skeletonema marinoi]|uniref:Protein 21.1 n=1 Tax=Skeletonema marinoi TaxID=267567 RepID=A0AAD8YH64_9STRA|nr:hypothetical protein QTG54_004316 [Skeletonema marinoi]